MKIPHEVVRKAWSEAPHGITENFMGYRVVKDKKMVLFTKSVPENIDPRAIRIVAFPKLEHIETFKEVRNALDMGGPSDDNRGAVGTMEIGTGVMNRYYNAYLVRYAQSHFMTTNHERGASGYRFLPRKYATMYAGWRIRCLKEAISLAERDGRTLCIPRTATRRGYQRANREGTHFEEEIIAFCRKNGIRFVEAEEGINIIPKPKAG